jgi:hypothetical protein
MVLNPPDGPPFARQPPPIAVTPGVTTASRQHRQSGRVQGLAGPSHFHIARIGPPEPTLSFVDHSGSVARRLFSSPCGWGPRLGRVQRGGDQDPPRGPIAMHP